MAEATGDNNVGNNDFGNNEFGDLPLGRDTGYPDQYDAAILCPIARRPSRESLGIEGNTLPFYGEDIWNAYELSWLDPRGKPVVAQAEFRVPVDTPAIIESKSLKLYLNSLNQTRFESQRQVRDTLARDLSATAGGRVAVKLSELSAVPIVELPGQSLDSLAIDVTEYRVNPDYLHAADETADEQLHSHLLRSLCPVTGQPDWASLLIVYRGPAIDHRGLLRYIVSYRQHRAFHEQCVERIFRDIHVRCRPQKLLVYARYLRRGGLDINPLRSSDPAQCPNFRPQRQ